MIYKKGECNNCSHLAVCSFRKQRDALIQKLEYEAKLLENSHFEIRCDCKHFMEQQTINRR